MKRILYPEPAFIDGHFFIIVWINANTHVREARMAPCSYGGESLGHCEEQNLDGE